jgi:hypothetical protein
MEFATDGEPDREPDRSGHRYDQPRHLRPAGPEGTAMTIQGGHGPGDAGKLIDALRSSADQELTIAERLASKARQAFALGAGFFVVAQTVAFGNFDVKKISTREQHWIIGLAVMAVVILGVAAVATLKADATVTSGDLPLEKLEMDLNAAYEGDEDVIGRLGGYYLGVVRTRRDANTMRRRWYGWARRAAALSLLATTVELVFALIARAT